MESRPVLLRGRDKTARKVLLHKSFPAGEFFIAPIQPEVDGKTHRTTDVMTRDWIVRQRVRVIAVVVMAVDIVEQTAHVFTQGVIENQEPVSLRTADCLGLLEQIHEPTVIDTVLEPGRLGEEAGQVRFVCALQHTARDVGQAFIVQNDQACQVMLKMAKLAPILKKIATNVFVGGKNGNTENACLQRLDSSKGTSNPYNTEDHRSYT